MSTRCGGSCIPVAAKGKQIFNQTGHPLGAIDNEFSHLSTGGIHLRFLDKHFRVRANCSQRLSQVVRRDVGELLPGARSNAPVPSACFCLSSSAALRFWMSR